MEIQIADGINLVVGVAILGFLWSLHRDMSGLHRDMAGLRDRMARIEGLFEGFTGRHGQETSFPATPQVPQFPQA